MGAIAPIRTANGAFFREFRAHTSTPPGKFLRLKFFEM